MLFNSENQMQQFVNKHQWGKISKNFHGLDTQSKVDLAIACGSSSDEDASDFLIYLLEDSDENVLMQAVKSLGMVGYSNAKTHLLALLWKLPDGKEDLKAAIKEAVAKTSERR